MRSDKELFRLAKDYVMLIDLYAKDRLYREEFSEEMDKIRNEVLRKGYDIDKFVEFQNLYRKLSIKDYYDFIKILD